MMFHRDRRTAGVELARALERRSADSDLVVGLARGGVVVASSVATRLDRQLGVAAVSVMRASLPAGVPVGAATSDGTRWVDEDLVHARGVDLAHLDAETASAIVRARWAQRRLGAAGHRVLHGRSVLLVDDGLVWAGRAIAAARWARRHGAVRVVLAVPVASRAVAEQVRPEVDGLLALHTEDLLAGLAEAYLRLPPVDLAEVWAIAREHEDVRRPQRRPPTLRRTLAAIFHRRTAFA